MRQRRRLEGEWARAAARGRGSRTATRGMQPNPDRACREVGGSSIQRLHKNKQKAPCYAQRAMLATEWGSAPDEHLKGFQEEGGVPREYPRQLAIFVFMDQHLHVQCSQTRQRAHHLAINNSSANNTLFSVKLTLSALTSSRRAAEVFASDKRRRRSVAIECSLGDGIEASVDEKQGVEVNGPGKKR